LKSFKVASGFFYCEAMDIFFNPMKILPYERRQKIIRQLQRKKSCSIEELSRVVGVSSATIHRDLAELNNAGIVLKVHGGALLSENAPIESEDRIHQRLHRNVEEKREIAAKALKLVKEESVIFLDHSSTCVYLARELAEKNPSQLVLFTNSVKILDELEGRFPLSVVSTGGTLQHRWNALTGPYVIDFLSRVNFNQAFISCGAISPTRGLMTSFLFVAEILRKTKQVSQEVNLLVDSSKFNKLGAFSIMPIKDVDRIITDRNLAPEIVKQYEDAGLEIVL